MVLVVGPRAGSGSTPGMLRCTHKRRCWLLDGSSLVTGMLLLNGTLRHAEKPTLRRDGSKKRKKPSILSNTGDTLVRWYKKVRYAQYVPFYILIWVAFGAEARRLLLHGLQGLLTCWQGVAAASLPSVTTSLLRICVTRRPRAVVTDAWLMHAFGLNRRYCLCSGRLCRRVPAQLHAP